MSELDLTAFDNDVLLARGKYATVRGAREDAVKALQVQCSQLQSIPSIVLRHVQEGQTVDELLAQVDTVVAAIKEQVVTVLDLHRQKEALKPEAWGK